MSRGKRYPLTPTDDRAAAVRSSFLREGARAYAERAAAAAAEVKNHEDRKIVLADLATLPLS